METFQERGRGGGRGRREGLCLATSSERELRGSEQDEREITLFPPRTRHQSPSTLMGQQLLLLPLLLPLRALSSAS